MKSAKTHIHIVLTEKVDQSEFCCVKHMTITKQLTDS